MFDFVLKILSNVLLFFDIWTSLHAMKYATYRH